MSVGPTWIAICVDAQRNHHRLGGDNLVSHLLKKQGHMHARARASVSVCVHEHVCLFVCVCVCVCVFEYVHTYTCT